MVAAAIGLLAVLAAGRGGSVRRTAYPWMLYESAKLHVGIMGSLAGFAFTGIVLIVTLARERTGVVGSALDTAIVMFLVAYLFGVGNAFLISYMPHADMSGELAPRVHSASPRPPNIARSSYCGSPCCRCWRQMDSTGSLISFTFCCPPRCCSDRRSSRWRPTASVCC